MLPIWTVRANSINAFLAWDLSSERQRKKRSSIGRFDPCTYQAGKSCSFFQRALPRRRPFFPEARSRRTTAMGGFTWHSRSPPPSSTLGENACNRTAYRSKARWSGRAAARASIFVIPTVIRGSEVVLKSRAHVVGDIQHQRLSIDPGAYFEGRSICSPEANAQKSPEKLTARLRRETELKATREPQGDGAESNTRAVDASIA